MKLTQNSISDIAKSDSLSFLHFPIKATCPSCRKKTIDSIVKYQYYLGDRQFVIISGNGTRSIGSYFKQQERVMPTTKGIFYDTVEFLDNPNLTASNPNIYYSAKSKVYRKVACQPSTIRDDLRRFFSGK